MHAVAYRGGGGGESPWAALLRGWQKKRNCWAMKGCFCFTVTISYDVNVNAWRSRILRLTTKKQKGHRNFFISAVVDISFVWRAANKITVPGGTVARHTFALVDDRGGPSPSGGRDFPVSTRTTGSRLSRFEQQRWPFLSNDFILHLLLIYMYVYRERESLKSSSRCFSLNWHHLSDMCDDILMTSVDVCFDRLLV